MNSVSGNCYTNISRSIEGSVGSGKRHDYPFSFSTVYISFPAFGCLLHFNNNNQLRLSFKTSNRL
jgi:hypothetical protein